MKDKSLQDRAINIKGNQYVLVSDRIKYFNDNFPNGSIHNELISFTDNTYIIKSTVIPDMSKPDRYFTGHSQAKIGQGTVNTTAALENAETSACGRALAMMGIGVIDSIASVDEMNKAASNDKIVDDYPQTYTQSTVSTPTGTCPKCGAPMARSKSTGKLYCSKLCWKKPQV